MPEQIPSVDPFIQYGALGLLFFLVVICAILVFFIVPRVLATIELAHKEAIDERERAAERVTKEREADRTSRHDTANSYQKALLEISASNCKNTEQLVKAINQGNSDICTRLESVCKGHAFRPAAEELKKR